MFRALVLILSLAGNPVGVGVGQNNFPTKPACEASLPAYVAKVDRDLPGHKLKATCVDKAEADKIESEIDAAKAGGSI